MISPRPMQERDREPVLAINRGSCPGVAALDYTELSRLCSLSHAHR
jgi:hypothetical protein